jgi:hypothetical protein
MGAPDSMAPASVDASSNTTTDALVTDAASWASQVVQLLVGATPSSYLDLALDPGNVYASSKEDGVQRVSKSGGRQPI